MKLIPLSQTSKKHGGKHFAMVDDEDYDYLMQWKWHLNIGKYSYYAVRSAPYREKDPAKLHRDMIMMHRAVLRLTDKNLMPDHKDKNGLNNQKHNLKTSTRSQNNATKKPHGRSKYLGVNFNLTKSGDRKKTYDKWISRITDPETGKRIYLGRYDTEEEAARAYDVAAKRIHGDFANLNFPNEKTPT